MYLPSNFSLNHCHFCYLGNHSLHLTVIFFACLLGHCHDTVLRTGFAVHRYARLVIETQRKSPVSEMESAFKNELVNFVC